MPTSSTPTCSLSSRASRFDAAARRHTRRGFESAPRAVRTRRIDVEIDDLDAGLRPRMAAAVAPPTLAELNVSHLVEVQAFPLAAARQAGLAAAGELKDECHLVAPGVAEDDRAQRALVTVIATEHLLALRH